MAWQQPATPHPAHPMTGHFEARAHYQVWLPAGYDRAKRWPAILFLHGSGERGDDNDKQTRVGLGAALRSGKFAPAAIVIFPQCPAGSNWVAEKRLAVEVLEAAQRKLPIDPRRVALTGMSMGGAGAWALAAAEPKRFSALAPVCAYVHVPAAVQELREPAAASFEELAARLPRIPIWILHGAADPVVPVDESRGMAAVLGANAAYTEFPGVGHDAWDPAYTTTGLVEWLTRQRR
jgi:predicted peptidase